MPHLVRRFAHPALLPGALILGSAAGIVLLDGAVLGHPVVRYTLPAVVATGLFLAWRYSRDRLAAACLLVLFAQLAATLGAAPAQGQYACDLAGTLLPANFLLLALLRDRGLLTLRGLGLVLLAPAQALLALWLYRGSGAAAADWLARPLVPLPELAGVGLPRATLGVFVLCSALTLLRAVAVRDPFTTSLFWAGTCSFVALQFAATRSQSLGTAMFAVTGLLLLLGLVESLHALAYRDPLTGLPGRRALHEALLRAGRTYTLAMVDADHFKKVNDRHGHDVGDQVLRMIAAQLATTRGGGKAFRYGGEEFTVLFPGREVQACLPHLEDLREGIAATAFSLRRGLRPRRRPLRARGRDKSPRIFKVTVSIGAAGPAPDRKHTAQVIKAADRALYRAKKNGRNQVRTS